MALFSLAFAVSMVPGLWGRLKAVDALAPPMQTQELNLYNEVHAQVR